jgi:hypothetical protein
LRYSWGTSEKVFLKSKFPTPQIYLSEEICAMDVCKLLFVRIHFYSFFHEINFTKYLNCKSPTGFEVKSFNRKKLIKNLEADKKFATILSRKAVKLENIIKN